MNSVFDFFFCFPQSPDSLYNVHVHVAQLTPFIKTFLTKILSISEDYSI